MSRSSVFSSVCALLLVLLSCGVSNGEIVASLDEPLGLASGVGNIRGWAYTTTSGASIVSPLEILIDGTPSAVAACCTSRSDVAVRLSGFSGQFNWALLSPGVHEIRVVIKSTSGEVLNLAHEFVSVRTANVNFATAVSFGEATQCFFSNGSTFGDGANFRCTNVLVTMSDGNQQQCPGSISYTWDKGSQSFKQSSDCE